MEKFHITITDNETNEVLTDKNTDAIIGAIHTEGDTGIIILTECNGCSLMGTAAGAMKAARESIEVLPVPLRGLIERLSNLPDDELKASK